MIVGIQEQITIFLYTKLDNFRLIGMFAKLR